MINLYFYIHILINQHKLNSGQRIDIKWFLIHPIVQLFLYERKMFNINFFTFFIFLTG